MIVAAIQIRSSGDRIENINTVSQALEQAAAKGARVAILPEAVQRSFGTQGEPLVSDAEPLDGQFVSALVEQARRHDLTVVAGMFEDSAEDREPFNTTVLIQANGECHAYRKIHLYDAYGFHESAAITPGSPEEDNLLVVDVDGFKIGVMTCFDLRFPELAVELVERGAEMLVLGAAWVPGAHKIEQWNTLLRARAIESTTYVVASAQPGPTYCGRSMIIDPTGTVLAEANDTEITVLTADVDRSVLDDVRHRMPVRALRKISSR